jgi:hypothetical protein
MNRFNGFTRALTLALLATLVAMAPALAEHHEDAEMELTAEVAGMLKNLASTGDKLLALARATPADKFAWSPNDEVRTISEVYIHAAATNLLLPGALGAAPPEGLEMTGSPFEMMAQWEAEITAKDDVIVKLEESLAYAHDALASITDLETEVALFGPPSPKRDYFLILVGHAHEHLGQSIAYARSAGVVPPWSQPAPAPGGDSEEAEEGEADAE